MKSKNPFTVVTSDYVAPDLKWEVEQYNEAGVTFRYHQLRQATPVELLEEISDADVLVVDQAKITEEVMQGLSRCRLIVRHGEGFDNLDLNAAARAGIVCINQPGFFSQNVAEQTLAMIMAIALRIPMQRKVATLPIPGRGWNNHHAMPYNGLKTLSVGILGYGKTGRMTARLLKPLVREVIVHDHHASKSEIESSGYMPVNLENLLSQSDIISLHVPATVTTAGMFNSGLIAKMKKGAILINTSRGSIVDTEALIQALKEGHLVGAALDTTQPEPLEKDHPLLYMDNVIITPHMCWYSENAMWDIRRSIVNDVLGILKGRMPKTVINPEVLDSSNCRLLV